MQRRSALLCAIALTAISFFLFTWVLPAKSPTLSRSTQSVTPEQPEPPEPPASPSIAMDAHPMDSLLQQMTLEQKVAQMFWVRCPDSNAIDLISQYSPAGFVLFARDFENKTREQVAQTVQSYQQSSSIPMLIGVDEEGGTVVRASKFKSIRSWPFESPQTVYAQGGLRAVESDTAEKDRFLKQMGINVNLAPVADVSTNPSDFMYPRTLGQDAAQTADYIGVVVRTMKNDKMGSVLKHFPGYGANGDTHTGLVIDTRPAQSFQNSSFLPFQAGIAQGAGAILVSHNIVQAYDATNPASLSRNIHLLLRDDLGFQGVIVTDDLSMDAVSQFTDSASAAVMAVAAGNDLLLSSDFVTQYQAVLNAVRDGTLSESTIHDAVRNVLQWKANLGLLEDIR